MRTGPKCLMRQTDNSDNSAGDRIENSTTEIIWLVETWKRHETISCYIDRLSDTINPHQILHASSFFSNIEFLRTLTPYSPLKWKIIDIQWRANIFRSIFIQKKKRKISREISSKFIFNINLIIRTIRQLRDEFNERVVK